MANDIDIGLLKQYEGALDGIEKKIDSIVASFVKLNQQAGAATNKIGTESGNVKKQAQEADQIAKQLEATEKKLKQTEDERYVILQRNKKALQDRNKEIKTQITTEKAAADSVVRMRQRLAELNKEYINASASARQKMAPAVNKLRQEIKNAEEVTGDHRRSVGDYGKAMTALPGPIQQAITAVRTLGAAMKTAFGPVVVIVGIIATLVKAMTRSEEGATKLRMAVAFLKGGFDVILDVITKVAVGLFDAFQNPKQALQDFGKLLLDNVLNRFRGIVEAAGSLGKIFSSLFKGEFGEAKTAAKELGQNLLQVATGLDETQQSGAVNFFKDLGKEIAEDAKASAELAKQTDLLRRFNADNLVTIAKLNEQKAELIRLTRDETESEEARTEALEQARVIQEQIKALETEAAQRKYDIAKAQFDLAESTIEDYESLKQAESELAAVNKKFYDQDRELINRQRELKNSVAAQNTKIAKEQEDLDLAEIEADSAKLDEKAKNLQKTIDLNNKEIEANKEKVDKLFEQEEQAKTNRQAAAQAGEQAISAIFDRSTQNQLKALEEKKEKGTITEQEYEKEREKIEKKSAQRNKIIQIGRIGLELALATAQLNFVKIAAATGALVTAIATPAYAMGTDYAESRFWFGEAGHELGQKRDGSFFYANKPTLIDNPSFKGAKIWNKHETDQIFAGNMNVGFDDSRIVNELARGNNRPIQYTDVTTEGIMSATRKGNTVVKYLSRF